MMSLRAGILILLFGPGLAACADDLGREWQTLDTQSSAIEFKAPGLETQNARFMRSYNERQSVLVENAMWIGPEARHPKAIVQYYRTSPGYYFPSRSDPQDLLKRYTALKDKEMSFGPLRMAVNGLGRIDYRAFGFDSVSCVVFFAIWGASAGAGDQRLVGYYCADPGEPLDEATIERVVKSVDVR